MSALLWRLARDQTIEALVMGTLVAQARQRQTRFGPSPVPPHPIPDLLGAPVEVIVEAVFGAIATAHAPTEPSGEWSDAGCPSCTALIDLASHNGDPTGMEWPDPVRRLMADLIDAELAARKE
jgi:hypothetical protein